MECNGKILDKTRSKREKRKTDRERKKIRRRKTVDYACIGAQTFQEQFKNSRSHSVVAYAYKTKVTRWNEG